MEWVETTGRTLEEAKEAALDQLGVDEQDAEFDVLAEPKPGLFGRVRGEARVRARVRPNQPRPKVDRRDRRRRTPRAESESRPGESGSAAPKAVAATAAATAATTSGSRSARRGRRRGGTGKSGNGSVGGEKQAAANGGSKGSVPAREDATPRSAPVTVDEQGVIAARFMTGLLEAFGLAGTVHVEKIDDDTVEVQVSGDDLGLMIGPKGATLQAIQDLARTVVQHEADGEHQGRVRIDIGAYRQRRREALERFTRQVAADVRQSGASRALEAMNAADRKVVHDTVNDLDGVRTISEGVEPNRRVVILPAGAD
jgi:spoIIIJ-associated protein